MELYALRHARTRSAHAERRACPALRGCHPRCDVDAALDLCDADIEFLSVLAVDGRPYVGHDGIRRYFDDINSAWEEWRVDIHGTAVAPDGRVIIEMTMHALGKGSGAPLAEFAAHVWMLRSGKLVRNQPFRDREQAERAVGLSDL
jgi:ketosteroid isomerase-like protein